MREIRLKCNICGENEFISEEKLYGISFIEDNKLQIHNPEDADIHICSVCIKGIKECVFGMKI